MSGITEYMSLSDQVKALELRCSQAEGELKRIKAVIVVNFSEYEGKPSNPFAQKHRFMDLEKELMPLSTYDAVMKTLEYLTNKLKDHEKE